MMGFTEMEYKATRIRGFREEAEKLGLSLMEYLVFLVYEEVEQLPYRIGGPEE